MKNNNTRKRIEENLFTEASLVSSVLYKSFNNNAEMSSIIINAMKNSIVINENYIQEQLMQIKRVRISPLSDDVLSAFNNGDIVLLYSIKTNMPQALPFFVTKTQNRIKTFIFMNHYGTISKSSLNSDEKYLSISMKDLYVLMEGAYIAYRYAVNPTKVTRTLGLMKVSCSIYTNMLIRILNKEYSLSMDQELYAKVVFCIGKFFLKNVWMSNNEELNFSYAYNNVGNGLTRAEMLTLSDEMESRNITLISELIEYMKEFSPRLASLNFRYFVQCYINTFKGPATFGLECLPYFLFTIESSMIGSFIIGQPIISDITKNIKGMNTFYPELVKAVS